MKKNHEKKLELSEIFSQTSLTKAFTKKTHWNTVH